MSLFKYFTQAGALRYLSTWALRITPPDQFNDPFEMRPRVTAMTTQNMQEMYPGVLHEELVNLIAQHLPVSNEAKHLEMLHCLARYVADVATEDDYRILSSQTDARAWQQMEREIEPFKRFLKQQQQEIWSKANEEMPAWNRKVESILHAKLPTLLGVLCLSGSDQNALMWSHYADSHRGALIEFDENHSTFKRRRSNADELGHFRHVCYSDTRPHINAMSGEQVFVQLALTKALDWAYEQEQRLLWPLTMADRHVPTDTETIHLLDVPPNAVKSVTVGCRTSVAFVERVAAALSAVDEAVHIRVYQAAVDDDAFKLNYKAVR
jgi:Protein of unknown function (DUF2971)